MGTLGGGWDVAPWLRRPHVEVWSMHLLVAGPSCIPPFLSHGAPSSLGFLGWPPGKPPPPEPLPHVSCGGTPTGERDFTPSTCRRAGPSMPRPLPLLPVPAGRSQGWGSGAPVGVLAQPSEETPPRRTHPELGQGREGEAGPSATASSSHAALVAKAPGHSEVILHWLLPLLRARESPPYLD